MGEHFLCVGGGGCTFFMGGLGWVNIFYGWVRVGGHILWVGEGGQGDMEIYFG